jgi:hypothetical protein
MGYVCCGRRRGRRWRWIAFVIKDLHGDTRKLTKASAVIGYAVAASQEERRSLFDVPGNAIIREREDIECCVSRINGYLPSCPT